MTYGLIGLAQLQILQEMFSSERRLGAVDHRGPNTFFFFYFLYFSIIYICFSNNAFPLLIMSDLHFILKENQNNRSFAMHDDF